MTKENTILITEAQADALLKVGVKAEVSYYISAELAQTISTILKPGGRRRVNKRPKKACKEFTLSERASTILNGKKFYKGSLTTKVGKKVVETLELHKVYARSYIQKIVDEFPGANGKAWIITTLMQKKVLVPAKAAPTLPH